MDYTMVINLLVPWIAHVFPSFNEYLKVLGPTFVVFVTALGIFTNILPAPGHQFPVPDVTALQVELQGSGHFIIKIALFARKVTFVINWFLATTMYQWFYNGTNKLSAILNKVKLAPKPLTK